MNFNRYDKADLIVTDLDPIEDLLNLISFLKSREFTSDLLKSRHGFKDAKKIKQASELIAFHAETAIEFAKQAYSGPEQMCFLPLYYSAQSLAKIFVLMKDKGVLLEKRTHGAKYDYKDMNRKFFNEKITIYRNGTIPAFYNAVTSKNISKTGLKVKIGDLYANISSVGAEYSIVTGKRENLFYHSAKIRTDDKRHFYLRIDIGSDWHKLAPPEVRMIKAYKGLKRNINPDGSTFYHTKPKLGTATSYRNYLNKNTNRYLISDYRVRNGFGWFSGTPLSSKHHIFNEEISILLAYFHLSNVVRYNPEHLYKLMDSKYWPILIGLRKHGYLLYLKLMWGHYNRVCFDLQ